MSKLKKLPGQQITYGGMLWLLAAQLIIMLPFTLHLPLWLIPILAFTAGWRIRAMNGHTRQPGTLIKILLIAGGLAGLALSGLPFPSLDLMVTLLLLGYAFKSLEVLQQRDAIIVVFLGYFLVAVYFLYSQSLLAGLYGIIALVIQTAALIGIRHPMPFMNTARTIRHNLRLSGLLLLQCLPLMLIIFVFAPRLPPLFTLPLTPEQAKTGVSDQITPGDIAQLSQSDDLAFRVTFKGERPAQSELYWRGLTLNHFDGRKWAQFAGDYEFRQLKSHFQSVYPWKPDNFQVEGDAIEYEAIYEKTGQPWLFTLTPATEVYGDVIRGADYRVMATHEIHSPTLLQAVSYPKARRDITLSNYVQQLTLQLPNKGNQRTHALAKRLYAGSDTKQEYIRQVLQRYRNQAFYYTLRPPLLGDEDTIDNFLFDSQRGFCAHYAGSFVFMMRAAGIPARVVAGYQGGEWNEQGQHLSVYQFDAHAWTEVWLENEGWVRIDPTTMVAPERTERGLEAAMQQEGSFLENQLFSTRKVVWLNQLRKKMDSVQHGWRRWVLGYDNAMQGELLQKLLGEITLTKIITVIGSLFAAIALLWVLFIGIGRQRNKEAEEHKLYRKFAATLAKKGLKRKPDQTPNEFALVAAQALPKQKTSILTFNTAYEQLCYIPEKETTRKDKLILLKKALTNLR
uniref:FIG001454: Transglutaminase-like enzymes, putative cysteine proteases n=1 Tax=uncultured Thiotrichaceae bacterium TaxID=298394 RepID=A0A6S6U3W3_9GAMM|nr:MAG: FIG001454: Transglutaminase-like enzymes, putative cysteine proteases [uncultured Thiotrichaceae bacterium]